MRAGCGRASRLPGFDFESLSLHETLSSVHIRHRCEGPPADIRGEAPFINNTSKHAEGNATPSSCLPVKPPLLPSLTRSPLQRTGQLLALMQLVLRPSDPQSEAFSVSFWRLSSIHPSSRCFPGWQTNCRWQDWNSRYYLKVSPEPVPCLCLAM